MSATRPWGMVVPVTPICALSSAWRPAWSPCAPPTPRPTPPLNAYWDASAARFRHVLAADLTACVRVAVALHPDPAYKVQDVSIRSMRAGGAMALLCTGVDSDRIRLLGQWRSDEMYRYLFVQAQPVMTGLAAAMFRGGSFRLTPS